jgi:hypothetical protein
MNLVKENLKIFTPQIVTLVDSENFPWGRINSKFNKRIDKILAEETSDVFNLEATIYDHIISAKKKNSSSLGLLKYFNLLFKELNKNLVGVERDLVKTNVINMLSSFDKQFLNYLGELAVLNQLIKSSTFSLIACEEELPNGKSIDFLFENKIEPMKLLVEVVNIHINDEKVEKDNDKIKIFFQTKLEQKIDSKKQGLDQEIDFHLVPVIWGGIDSLKIYEDFFKNNSIDIPCVYEPMAYLTYSDDHEYYEHYFNPVSKLFK